jgi:predicted Zn-dependent peptidase
MADCIQTFNLILDTLPQSQASFQIAKESLLKQLSCQRTTRSAVLNAWLAARERGVDYDLNQRIYDGLPALTLDDIVRFASDHMARKPRRYIILGNEHELDMAILSKLGPIRRVSLEDIFGY